MYINEHNNLLLVVSLASFRLLSSTSCRTSFSSLASTTRCRLDNICVFDVFDISIARSMYRWVDSFVEEKQIDVCSAFKKRTHDAIVASRTTRRYVFVLVVRRSIDVSSMSRHFKTILTKSWCSFEFRKESDSFECEEYWIYERLSEDARSVTYHQRSNVEKQHFSHSKESFDWHSC